MFKFRKKDTKAKKVRKSKSFKRAKSKAKDYLNSPDKIHRLIDKAKQKAKRRNSPLKEFWESLMTCFRLLKAYAKGTYRDIPWESLVLILTSVIYFVMPIDLIPDFIAGIGLLDDASLLAWAMASFAVDIERFAEWEKANETKDE